KSTRQPEAIRSRPRARTNRRDHDRDRLHDWLGHFYHVGGIVATEWRAGVAAAGVGTGRFVNNHRRALLLRACDHDAACRRRLCFSPRSIWTLHRILVWVDIVPC